MHGPPQDPETVNIDAYKASVRLAMQRLELYREDAESARKLTKEKGGRKKKDSMHAWFRTFIP